jgi:hypothetical protein
LLISYNRTLSAGALAALQEFYSERDAHIEKLENLKAQVEAKDDQDGVATGRNPAASGLSIHTFTEDWNESQFWVCSLFHTLPLLLLSIGGGDKQSNARAELVCARRCDCVRYMSWAVSAC